MLNSKFSNVNVNVKDRMCGDEVGDFKLDTNYSRVLEIWFENWEEIIACLF